MEILKHKYLITTTRKVYKSLRDLPEHVQERLAILLKQLALQGPIAHNWPNYSKLGKNRYHCHLKYSYVACWTCEENSIQIEVYYVGSRESAPY
jgi:mRNA-degrading endonuclease RelE of RelBE toxin-antitoxin system